MFGDCPVLGRVPFPYYCPGTMPSSVTVQRYVTRRVPSPVSSIVVKMRISAPKPAAVV